MASPLPQACPITPVIELVFGRWSTEVLWVLLHHGTQRFTELQRALPAVSPKVLTQRLRELERDGLVTRAYYAEMPPRVEYDATPLAESLQPVFATLAEWAGRHLEEVQSARAAFAHG